MAAHRPSREKIIRPNFRCARAHGCEVGIDRLNNKLKVTFRRAYGLRTFKATEVALYHALGHLPEPEFTHRFF